MSPGAFGVQVVNLWGLQLIQAKRTGSVYKRLLARHRLAKSGQEGTVEGGDSSSGWSGQVVEPAQANPEIYLFSDFLVDPAAGHLLCRGARVDVHPKPFEVLCCLAKSYPRLLRSTDLLRLAWPNVVVSQWALSSALRDLRRALANHHPHERIVSTLRGRGYRLAVPVAVRQAERLSGETAWTGASSDAIVRALTHGARRAASCAPPFPAQAFLEVAASLGGAFDVDQVAAALGRPAGDLLAYGGEIGLLAQDPRRPDHYYFTPKFMRVALRAESRLSGIVASRHPQVSRGSTNDAHVGRSAIDRRGARCIRRSGPTQPSPTLWYVEHLRIARHSRRALPSAALEAPGGERSFRRARRPSGSRP